MRARLTTTLALAAVTALGLGLAPTATAAPKGGTDLDVIGLAGDRTLVAFTTADPKDATVLGQVTGLADGDTRLVGIDHRVSDGSLLGLGDGGGIYQIDPATRVATLLVRLTGVTLQGSAFDIDVNPVPDALRIISDTGQNLRQPLVRRPDGTFAPTTADKPLNGAATTGVTGAAYTNNDSDGPTGTGTTLFDLATETDQLVRQAPPNEGTLVPVGSVGRDLTGDTGFDIHSSRTNESSAFAVDEGRLFSVDLATGATRNLGKIGKLQVTDLAIPQNQG